MARQVDVTDRLQSVDVQFDELCLLAVRAVAVVDQLTEVTAARQQRLAHLSTCQSTQPQLHARTIRYDTVRYINVHWYGTVTKTSGQSNLT